MPGRRPVARRRSGSCESDPPHVVVSDVMMPGLGGMEVLQRIKRHYPEIQVILLTGMTYAIEAEEAAPPGSF